MESEPPLYSDWNRKVFEDARRRREAEFDKILKEQQTPREEPKWATLFQDAPSVTDPSTK
jgi:hypothetical protein